jgi:hypothetical protein
MGKVEYLGMNLDFTQMLVFQVDMIKYIGEVVVERTEEMTKSSFTPHNTNVFKTRDYEESHRCHRTNYKVTWMYCPDTLPCHWWKKGHVDCSILPNSQSQITGQRQLVKTAKRQAASPKDK